MFRWIMLLLLLTTGLISRGQSSPFRGRIDYVLSSTDSSVVVRIKTWYFDQKIKMVTEVVKAGPADVKNETIYIDFKNAVIDRIKDDKKIVERESMRGKGYKADIPKLEKEGLRDTILGYPATALTTGAIRKTEIKDSVEVSAEAEIMIFYADRLFFPVPDSLYRVQMAPLFTNGQRLALGSRINVAAGPVKLDLRTRAVRIERGRKRLKQVFTYPAGYSLVTRD